MKYEKNSISVLDVYITGKCNFQCPYCFGEDSEKVDISLETFSKVLNFARYTGSSIGLTGGEPLLHDNLRDLVYLANKKKVPLILRTNGIILNEFIDILHQFEWIGVSIDGIGKINNILRPNSKNYNYTINEKIKLPLDNIKLIKRRYPKQKILLASLATSFNLESLIDLALLLSKKNIPVHKWKIYQFTRNHFRSLNVSKKYDIETKMFSNFEKILNSKFNGELIFKYGEGNCIIIDTIGNVRINQKIIGSINDNYSKLVENILNTDEYCKIIDNKGVTYND